MKLWSDFYDLVVPDLPGCPFAAVDSALRQAAIAFCEQSLAWKYVHPSVSVVAGTATYAFIPPAEAAVHAITYAELDDKEIESHAGESGIRIARWRHRTGTPEYILGGPAFLTLVPAPCADGSLTMIVALKPAPASTGIDDTQYNEYREAIAHGAMARMMLSPKKPYTDLPLAQHHAQQFAIKTAAAGIRVASSHTRAPLITAILQRG
ncbi:hypothetical protein SAMN05216420_10424 [Nitrosospira sp. Nl5]|uniref:phage adaptor protein n=1 Tax=Nitrosospira sp. Nl5 TaxID=200120 RepID=UPI00088F5C42|nr:hypothetical protein [Nitrosospira sp. Nl5]SCY26002.1 hypothetical protein SAMN05216420_10424 [Nitrosospira sp. Nl5]